ncbi:hypothetical protein L13192_09047 [Pyrenophora tritici-repentis]|uniref:Uncharacterized protein n=1 Tax=Pyrenophora tritici-repentis TaxID=45151 RepID=A0A922NHD5_9PLEO|nr:hypothetical protein Ptr86124_006869 [Pyrenophora tritici-repentis]KAI1666803.1 hypothetical protein L13192_09047 [Pyrenophora tritici-repentis]KAI1682641.1 hypothetical protein KJE20_07373 [Pyrenophora tritici-repentis]
MDFYAASLPGILANTTRQADHPGSNGLNCRQFQHPHKHNDRGPGYLLATLQYSSNTRLGLRK